MRLAIDTGGTFTDLVVEGDDHRLRLYKSPTTPRDPAEGMLAAIDLAAADAGVGRRALLQASTKLVHATTRATNAIVLGRTARTALLTTAGHPDILVFREGGRTDPFDFSRRYPDPYIPRSLTIEVQERIGSAGEICVPLDEDALRASLRRLEEQGVEAIAVCLLWSIVNPVHELRVGEVISELLPAVPFTLSHELNPILREYRRASSTAIDASLKPLMSDFLHALSARFAAEGFDGQLLFVSSTGGLIDARDVARAPIHAIRSGPAMAPVAGRLHARVDADAATAVIADTGGTTYDVTLVRAGRIPRSRETWLGRPYEGHLTGFPAVDVKSVGAGGGSIAWIDDGGLLQVGPQSAGSDPGPVCYGRGGEEPTVTDASLVAGHIDPAFFVGGTMELDVAAAHRAVASLGLRLSLDPLRTATAILELATERMATAIEEITIDQGVDPREAVLVGGGGAAGLNVVAIARRLGFPHIVIPETSSVLSAAGALMSDMTVDYRATCFATTSAFSFAAVNDTLARLEAQCRRFADRVGAAPESVTIERFVEARYPQQVWELDVPLRLTRFADEGDVERLRQDFHALHAERFAVSDPASPVEVVSLRLVVSCRSSRPELGRVVMERSQVPARSRVAAFIGTSQTTTAVWRLDQLTVGERLDGPVIVESPVTTVVIDPGASVELAASGSLMIDPHAGTVETSSAARTSEARR